jgi:capsular polysaccharide biosynthesis protein
MHPRSLRGEFYSKYDFVLNRRVLKSFKNININKTVAIISNRNKNNYYHFMTDLVTKLLMLLEYNLPFDHIIAGVIWQGKIIELLEFLEKDYIGVGVINGPHTYHFTHSIVPSMISPDISPYKIRLYEKHVRSKISFNPTRKLYISRSRAMIRKLSNESQIIELLKKYEFEVVYLENMSLMEQINLFSSAKVVLSVHGAGLTNILFCDKRVNVIELFPKDTYETLNHYYRLANYLGMNYFMLEGSSKFYSSQEFNINLDKLEDILLLINSNEGTTA